MDGFHWDIGKTRFLLIFGSFGWVVNMESKLIYCFLFLIFPPFFKSVILRVYRRHRKAILLLMLIAILNQQIRSMSIAPNFAFLTPQKRPQPDPTKNCNSSVTPRPWGTSPLPAKTIPSSPAASQSWGKLPKSENRGCQRRLLRELGTRVKKIIKQNGQLRGGGSAGEEVQTLRKEKEQLQAVIDQLRRGESARESTLSEENLYLREYITRRKDDNARGKQNFQATQSEQPSKEINEVTHRAVPKEKVQSLRRYVMEYINTVIESNDQKLMAQQRYLQTLQKRVENLDKFNQLAAHLKFERTVKLQESGRKSKNFTAGAPTVPGDYFQYELEQIETVPASHHKASHFAGRSVKASPKARSGREMAALVIRSAQLQEELSLLQEKYQAEIESHIRDCSDREELVLTVQKLAAEKKELRHRVCHLEGELQAAQRKVAQLEKVREGRTSILIEQQLAQIKKQLLSCGVDHYESVQRQLSQVFSQRDRLRRELSQLQSRKSQQSRFSSATKQIFLLREKNSQLQQNLQFYLHQIDQYQQQLRRIAEEGEERLARAISKDFKEMHSSGEEVQGLKWPRMAHDCMVNSIARLQHLQKQLSSHPIS